MMGTIGVLFRRGTLGGNGVGLEWTRGFRLEVQHPRRRSRFSIVMLALALRLSRAGGNPEDRGARRYGGWVPACAGKTEGEGEHDDGEAGTTARVVHFKFETRPERLSLLKSNSTEKRPA